MKREPVGTGYGVNPITGTPRSFGDHSETVFTVPDFVENRSCSRTRRQKQRERRRHDWKAIVVSKDEDFLYLTNQPDEAGRFLWLRLGNCRNDALIAAFSSSFDTIVAAFDSGESVVELI